MKYLLITSSRIPNFHKPFEVEIYASGYAMGTMLKQGDILICYHFELFYKVVLEYPTHDRELFVMVHDVNKWNHYFMDFMCLCEENMVMLRINILKSTWKWPNRESHHLAIQGCDNPKGGEAQMTTLKY